MVCYCQCCKCRIQGEGGGRDLGNAISFNVSKISKALPLSASSVGKCWSWYVLTLLVLVKLSENFKRKANHRSIPLSTSRIGKGKRGVLVLMQEDVVTLFAGLWELFDLKTKQITEGGGREVRSDATKPKNADEKEPTKRNRVSFSALQQSNCQAFAQLDRRLKCLHFRIFWRRIRAFCLLEIGGFILHL